MLENNFPSRRHTSTMPDSAQYVVGGNRPKPGRILRLWQKLWPTLASTQYKFFVLTGLVLVVAAITSLGITYALYMSHRSAEIAKEGSPDTTQSPLPNPSDADATTPDGTEAAPSKTDSPNKTTTKEKAAAGSAAKSSGSQSAGTTTNGGSSSGGSSGGSSPVVTTCPLPSYPAANCTGVPSGTSLTVVSGDLHITQAGEVVNGKDINGCVFVEAANVTIRSSKVTCNWAFGIRSFVASGLLIEDVEVSCGNTTATGVAANNFTARRLNVHGCENGFSVNNDALIEDSYIHDLVNDGSSHTDGIQIADNSVNITIRHNKILNQDPNGTSAIIGDTGSQTNILVEKNLLAGGAYAVFCAITPTNYRIIGNRFSRIYYANSGVYGPGAYCDGATDSSGNVWDDTGLPVVF